MSYLRRKTAVILSIILLLSTVVYGEQNTAEPVSLQASQSEEYILLNSLGFLDEEIGKLAKDSAVTRAQFASVQAKMMGFTDYSVPSDGFIDVAKGSRYEKEIYYLRDMNVINGVDEYRFKPDSPITVEQACAVAVTALGYKRTAVTEHGGYSKGYTYIAAQLGLLKDVTGSDREITAEESIKLLKNAALSLVYVEKKDGSSVSYVTEKGRTMIAEYCDIWEDYGIVTDNGVTALDGSSKAGARHMTIGSRTLSYDGNSTYAAYLGHYASYYYYGDEEELVYITDRANRNEIIRIDAENLDKDSTGINNVVYYKNGSSKTAKLSASANLIYNGSAYPQFGNDDLKIKSGFITLINNDGDGYYDVIVIEEYKDFKVNAYETDNRKIYGANGKIIDLSEYDNVTIYDNDGALSGEDSINTDCVVSYCEPHDKNVITIYISTNTVSGKIESSGTDIRPYYQINGEKYAASYSLLEDIENKVMGAELPKMGSSYLIRLNKYGEIVTAEETYGTGWKYAYYVGMYTPETEPDTTVIRLMMTDGNAFDAYTAKKVSVNGKTTASEKLKNDLRLRDANGGYIRQIVRVRLNGDGDLTAMQVSDGTENEYGYTLGDFSKSGSVSSARWYGNNTRVMGKYLIDASAAVFEDPDKDNRTSSLNTENIKSLKTSELKEGMFYSNIDFYNADATLNSQAAVYASRDRFYDTKIVTIRNVSEYADGDDEIKKKIAGISYGSEVEYPEDKDGVFPADLKTGDVIRVEISGGKAVSADKLISLADHPSPQISVRIGGSMYQAEWANMFGYVYAKSTNAVSLYMGDNPYGKVVSASLNGGSCPVTIYDAKQKTVSKGSLADIVSAGTISSDGSFTVNSDTMLFIYRRYENVREAVVVKYE